MKNIRSSNIEILRIICMLFIVAGHILMAHKNGEIGSQDFIIGQIMHPFFMVAVNAFVLISGYFGIKLYAKKLWKINDMVTFYSVIGLAASILLGVHSISIRQDFLYLFPIITKKYWFITVYFALCILSPALNFFIEKAEKEVLKKTILTGFILFVILPTVGYLFNFEAIIADAGYGIMNFILLYFIGRYVKLYNPLKNCKPVYCLLVYLGCSVACGLFQISYSTILGFSFTSFLSYNTIFIFIGAIALFVFFTRLNVGESRVINYIAGFSLCVYIIHLHPLAFSYIFNDLLHVESYHGASYIFLTLLLPIPVYAVCMAIEMIRKSLTGWIYRLVKL